MVKLFSTLLRLPYTYSLHFQNPIQSNRYLTRLMSTSSSNNIIVNKHIPSLIDASVAIKLYQNMPDNIKFLDGSWHMSKDRKPLDEYIEERIVNAQYFDIEEISDHSTTLPHMIPSSSEFSDYVSNLGISNSDHVIIYTKPGSFSAARCWWMFRLYGHDNVSILNGGITSWKETIGGTIESGIPTTKPNKTAFMSSFNDKYVVNAEQVLSIVNNGNVQIFDARSKARFLGEVPEPRPGLPGGHIPGSLNLPFTMLLDDKDVTKFKSIHEIKDIINDSGIILGANLVFSCGSGVTAAVLYFALHLLGIEMNKLAIYDGSWTEWASSNSNLPIVNPSKKNS